jgi:hypothetical protein
MIRETKKFVTEPFWTALLAKHILLEEYSKRSYAYLTLFVSSLGFGGECRMKR